MIICFCSIVLLSVFGLSSSDLTKKEMRTDQRNIFLDPIKPVLEHCETSLGEHGRCIPLKNCQSLREYAEGEKKDRLLSVIEDFGCGFRKVLFVCCTNQQFNFLKPFEGLDHLKETKDHSHIHHYGEHHHHHHHLYLPAVFSPPENFRGSKKSESERPYKTGINGDNFNENNKKPVYEETKEGDDVAGGRQPMETEESKDKATTPLWQSSDFIVSQEDSWVWPNARKSFETYQGLTTSKEIAWTNGPDIELSASEPKAPGWLVVHQTNMPSGSFGGLGQSTNQFGSPGLSEHSPFGSNQPTGSTGTFSSGGLLGGQSSTFGSNNQGFGISSQSSSGSYNNQAFSGGNSGFGSGLGNLDNQGFGNSRPGSSFSSNQGFSSGRPSQSGLNNQGPQVFGNERPSNQGFGSLSQGLGNERPLGSNFGSEHPNSGSNRPNNYDTYISRPSSGRPGNYSSNRPSNQDADLFGSGNSLSGGSNNQRPNNQRPNNYGSNKKPSRGGSNKRRLLPDGKCGTEISDKIIGGEDTKLDEFPWMALLHFSTNSGQDRGYGCGGSLINDRYVLTAAHCIKGPSLPDNVVVKTVRLGEYDLTKERDCMNDVCSPPPLDVAVEEIISHPDYKPNDKAQHHDIALIRLRKKVPFTTYISPICLPGDELKKKDYAGKQMVVAGWGKTSNGVNAKSSAIKQKVTLPFVTLEECKPFYNGINIRLRNSQICAGGERARDSCQGDSGGPLMTNEIVNGQPSWFATGIVSFGPEDCGIQNIAGVYTRVSEYVDWILDTMKE